MTGYSFGIGTERDYATIKYGSSGIQQWIQRFSGTGQNYDYPTSISVDDSGNVYVTGSSSNPFYPDYTTIKYVQDNPLLSNEVYIRIPSRFGLSQNYPNPFNPTTKINYTIGAGELPITNYVTLKIYDIVGKEVATLVNEKQNAGRYSVQFDGSNFASGVYFYKIQADGFNQVKKMVLLR